MAGRELRIGICFLAQFEWMCSSTAGAIQTGELSDWCLEAAQQRLDRTSLGEKTAALGLAIQDQKRASGEIATALEINAAANSDRGANARHRAMLAHVGRTR